VGCTGELQLAEVAYEQDGHHPDDVLKDAAGHQRLRSLLASAAKAFSDQSTSKGSSSMLVFLSMTESVRRCVSPDGCCEAKKSQDECARFIGARAADSAYFGSCLDGSRLGRVFVFESFCCEVTQMWLPSTRTRI
jgi:hypothetical protein